MDWEYLKRFGKKASITRLPSDFLNFSLLLMQQISFIVIIPTTKVDRQNGLKAHQI